MNSLNNLVKNSWRTAVVLVLLLCVFPAQAAEIRFVTWRDTQGFLDRLIRDFEAQNPDLKIVREIGPHSSTEFHDLVGQKFKNRDPEMDVFFMDVIWPAEFASAGWALPLDRFFPPEERKKFLSATILANTYQGNIYGVPLFVDAGLLYYRKDMLQRYNFPPPRAWPELVEQAKTILAGANDAQLSGFSGQFKQYEGLVCNMMEYIASRGPAFSPTSRLERRTPTSMRPSNREPTAVSLPASTTSEVSSLCVAPTPEPAPSGPSAGRPPSLPCPDRFAARCAVARQRARFRRHSSRACGPSSW